MRQNRFKEILRSKGERATKARVSILEALARERYPVSIKEIARKIKAPDQSTLYRILSGFARNELVREIILDRAEARYEIAIGREHHHHIVCTSCGAMEDVRLCRTKEAGVKKTSRKFALITGHVLEFFGICKSCAKA